MPSPTSLAAILQQIEPPRVPSPIQPLAQAMELRERFARLQQQHQFLPGDIVRQKAGIGHVSPDQCVVWIVIRRLTPSAYDEKLMADYVKGAPLMVSAYIPDLVVADIARTEGATMGLSLVCSDILEPVTDDELLTWSPASIPNRDAEIAPLLVEADAADATIIPLPQDEHPDA